ncbi:hypothetical protein K3Z95_01355 [Pseudomonas aeruginosa]|uniref:hypothetical protein n=2 Tax=Pseudomonas aeruginosa TaxID=287 RepID=UPI0004522EC7|nr:hypothetical protein [Pseudomonas aeruginosa]ETV28924.1 hypothetical protein Q046_05841 [Pseudomonas aeruginosa BWHPSA041]MCR3806888.1 hypothetical protein [Pseudomonas aeruginosa]
MSKKPVAWMKVYDPAGNYVASCVAAEAGAALMAMYGDGAEIRNGHSKKNAIWREGFEQQSAGESYDFVAAVVADRTTAKDTPLSPEEQRRSDSAQAALEQTRATVRRMLASQP